MLKEYYDSNKHLSKKMKHIVITNICNLTCGGCHQHCGNFDKDQLWFIKLEEFEKYVKILKLPENHLCFPNPHYVTKISIFGGEPTIHPQWGELLEIMYQHEDVLFRVSTNGRLHEDVKNPHPNFSLNVATFKTIIEIEKGSEKAESNVLYIIDPKDEEKLKNYSFVPTLVAPIDLYPEKSKEYFWIKSQRDCGIWKYCSASIYNNKAYFCEAAAAMDHLFNDGENGWEVSDQPFNKTPEEISEQAEKFCYRCAWCIKYDPALEKFKQKIAEPTLTSDTNIKSIRNSEKKFVDLVQITLPEKSSPPLRKLNRQ